MDIFVSLVHLDALVSLEVTYFQSLYLEVVPAMGMVLFAIECQMMYLNDELCASTRTYKAIFR